MSSRDVAQQALDDYGCGLLPSGLENKMARPSVRSARYIRDAMRLFERRRG